MRNQLRLCWLEDSQELHSCVGFGVRFVFLWLEGVLWCGAVLCRCSRLGLGLAWAMDIGAGYEIRKSYTAV
jgi:hypothetical protein